MQTYCAYDECSSRIPCAAHEPLPTQYAPAVSGEEAQRSEDTCDNTQERPLLQGSMQNNAVVETKQPNPNDVKPICPICFEDGNEMRTLVCKHSFCETCLVQYVESKVEECDRDFHCPVEDCEKHSSHTALETLLRNSKWLDEYQKMNNRVGVVLCPKCERRCGRGTETVQVRCSCGCSFCAVCRREDTDCWNFCKNEQELQFELDELGRAFYYEVKQCPRCAYVLMKDEGCSAVKCVYCKLKFCWECCQTEHQMSRQGHDCSDFAAYISPEFGENESDGDTVD